MQGRALSHYFFPVKHLELIWQLAVREVLQRFRGSWLGLGWALLTPLAMLAVYTFVFRTVLKARWPAGPDSNTEFALQLFSGLLVFTLFSDIIGRAPRLVIERPNLVKKVIFPLEILPWPAIFSALFHAGLSLLVLLTAVLFMRQGLTIHIVSVPFIVLAFLPLLLGLSWLLAAIGTYVRDLGHIVGLILTPMLFLSPVFYPISALPEMVQRVILFNPLTVIIESMRAAVLGNSWPDMGQLLVYFVVSLSIAWLGAFSFEKMRRGFADVV